MNTTANPDFKRIVRDLLKCGYTNTSLAEHVGSSQPTIHYLRTGKTKTPRYDIGAKLVALHEKEFPLLQERRNGPVSASEES